MTSKSLKNFSLFPFFVTNRTPKMLLSQNTNKKILVRNRCWWVWNRMIQIKRELKSRKCSILFFQPFTHKTRVSEFIPRKLRKRRANVIKKQKFKPNIFLHFAFCVQFTFVIQGMGKWNVILFKKSRLIQGLHKI